MGINWQILLVTAIVIELVTLFFRFVLKLKTKDVLLKIAKKLGLKKIVRIHHFFIGIIIFGIAYFMQNVFWISLGLGIALSDAVHHLILKIVTGRHEFELIYFLEKELKELEKSLEI